MKHTEPVPLIEVVRGDYTLELADRRVKFKGKLLHPEVLIMCSSDYVEAEMPAEILFDFTAGDLPDKIYFGVKLSEGECLGLLTCVTLRREKKYVIMDFSFEIDEEEPPKDDLNPYVVLPVFTQLAKREKYKVKTYENGIWGTHISFKVPVGDNVYSHYKKHLDALENLCAPIANDIIKRLNKRFKSKR